jgi:ABC-type sugar transport system ATPase subunit
MARIKLHNVSLTYNAPLREPVNKLFATRKESIQEDLPVETKVGITALDHVNLTVPHGQIFVVVGPSGCGKSTLLRVVAGIEKNYTGTISYDGEDMQSVPAGDRYIGMVFQNYAL